MTTSNTNAPMAPEICIELTDVYDDDHAEAIIEKLNEATGGCYMNIRFVACPAGGCLTICALTNCEDGRDKVTDMLMGILMNALIENISF